MQRLSPCHRAALAAATLIVAATAITLALHLDFVRRSSWEAAPLPATAIVFTGQFDRVELALALLDDGRIDRLFVSGVNVGAGITPNGFATLFRLSPSLWQALSSGQIILASDANSTLQNALETACWLERQPDIRAVVLITSRGHMARASLALERAVPRPMTVLSLSPEEGTRDLSSGQAQSEFIRFTATWIITLLPRRLWSQQRPATCGEAS